MDNCQEETFIPLEIRQLYSTTWDMFNGILILICFCLVTWEKIDTNLYVLLLVTYFDLIVIIDVIFSAVVRLPKMVEILVATKSLNALLLALLGSLGIAFDIISCLPFIPLLMLLDYSRAVVCYQVVNLLRFTRLFIDRRKSILQSKEENKNFNLSFGFLDEFKLEELRLSDMAHNRKYLLKTLRGKFGNRKHRVKKRES